MKLKIVSDGTADGTKVTDAETGQTIENIKVVSWSVGAGELAVAKLEMWAEVDVVGERELKVACPECKSTNVATERRPNGDTQCLDCGHKGPTGLTVLV